MYGLEVCALDKRALQSLALHLIDFLRNCLKLLKSKLFRHAEKCFAIGRCDCFLTGVSMYCLSLCLSVCLSVYYLAKYVIILRTGKTYIYTMRSLTAIFDSILPGILTCLYPLSALIIIKK